MLIFGGISIKEEYLNDTYVLDMNTFRWLKALTKGSKPDPIYNMSSTFVIQKERIGLENLNIYKLPDITTTKVYKKLKVEGIYIFGGINKDKLVNNDLRVLKIGNKPLEWIKLGTSGKKPAPRYSSSLNYITEFSLLVLHGGKDDSKEDFIYNDTYVLDLFTLNWIEIVLFGDLPYLRCNHSTSLLGNNLIILGGSDGLNYLNIDLYIINFKFYDKKNNKNKFYNYNSSNNGNFSSLLIKNSLSNLNKDEKKVINIYNKNLNSDINENKKRLVTFNQYPNINKIDTSISEKLFNYSTSYNIAKNLRTKAYFKIVNKMKLGMQKIMNINV